MLRVNNNGSYDLFGFDYQLGLSPICENKNIIGAKYQRPNSYNNS